MLCVTGFQRSLKRRSSGKFRKDPRGDKNWVGLLKMKIIWNKKSRGALFNWHIVCREEVRGKMIRETYLSGSETVEVYEC